MPRLIISVTDSELEALVQLATMEMRTPRDQARYLIHKELLGTNFFKKGAKKEPDLLPHMESENGKINQVRVENNKSQEAKR